MLLQHYGIVDAAEVDHFHKLARASKEPQAPWWTAYRGVVSRQYLNFLSYENSASVIQLFQPLLIPGLLQEEEYARARFCLPTAAPPPQSGSRSWWSSA
jgi:Domain of unknown function (DUF5753)